MRKDIPKKKNDIQLLQNKQKLFFTPVEMTFGPAGRMGGELTLSLPRPTHRFYFV